VPNLNLTYIYLIGFFGAFFARLASKFEKSTFIIEKIYYLKKSKRYKKTQNFTLISIPLKKFFLNPQKKLEAKEV
jgi:hypothetical protein